MRSIHKKKPTTSQLRIISGQLRNKRIPFPAINQIRPTPESVRETLFNWLVSDVVDSRCLDLFAGSGVLGFEAISRGAKDVVFVEKNIKAAKSIKQQIEQLGLEKAKAFNQDAFHWLKKQGGQGGFDIVFVDPPYSWSKAETPNEMERCLKSIENSGILTEHACIYVEFPKHHAKVSFPDNWLITRDKSCGQVRYCLCERNLSCDDNV